MTYDSALLAVWTSMGDRCWVYRQDARDRDSRGQSTGLRAVSTIQNAVCRIHATPNYDESSPVGQSKQNNIFTSDKLSGPLDWDLNSMDVVKVTTGYGETTWYTVSGDPKRRAAISHSVAFLNPLKNSPTIVAGSWAS